MKKIKLQRTRRVALVSDTDAKILKDRKWYAHESGGKIYARSVFNPEGEREPIYMHRLLMGAVSEMDIDHKDGDGLNNRRSNLRHVSRTINNLNCPHTAGCYFESRTGKWRAEIWFDYRHIRLGRFATKTAAAAAYQAKRRELMA